MSRIDSRRFIPVFVALALGLSVSAAADTPILRDNFSNPASGWPNRRAESAKDLGFAVYTDSGGYQLTPVSDNTFGFIAAPRQATSGDVHVEADMFLYAGIGAGAAGIACRGQDFDNFYAFIARGDAGVLIVKVKNGKATPLAKGQVSSVMAGSVDVRMTVECKGSILRLSTNKGARIEAHDSDFTAGNTGLLVMGEKMAGTSATFDNFVLINIGTKP